MLYKREPRRKDFTSWSSEIDGYGRVRKCSSIHLCSWKGRRFYRQNKFLSKVQRAYTVLVTRDSLYRVAGYGSAAQDLDDQVNIFKTVSSMNEN